MRISDWSSDVCSSDLVGQAERIDAVPAIEHDVGEIGPAPKHAEHRPLAAAVERDELALDHLILHPAAFTEFADAPERLASTHLGTDNGANHNTTSHLQIIHRMGSNATKRRHKH